MADLGLTDASGSKNPAPSARRLRAEARPRAAPSPSWSSVAFRQKPYVRTASREHDCGVQVAEKHAMRPCCRPHDMRLAGIVSGSDMPLQPLPRQLVIRRVSGNSYSHRKFPIHDFITVWCLASHSKNIKRTFKGVKFTYVIMREE